VRRRPDITLAKKALGWQPTVQLREGLLRTIDYFRSSDGAFMAPALAIARLDY
jgi:nucleoside-diphosphate-sugar epimerase